MTVSDNTPDWADKPTLAESQDSYNIPLNCEQQIRKRIDNLQKHNVSFESREAFNRAHPWKDNKTKRFFETAGDGILGSAYVLFNTLTGLITMGAALIGSICSNLIAKISTGALLLYTTLFTANTFRINFGEQQVNFDKDTDQSIEYNHYLIKLERQSGILSSNFKKVNGTLPQESSDNDRLTNRQSFQDMLVANNSVSHSASR